MTSATLRVLAIGLTLSALAGCSTDGTASYGYPKQAITKLRACYGYGCQRGASIPVTQKVADRFAAIMGPGRVSADAERRAVSKAVQYYEELSAQVIGVRDQPKSPVVPTGEKGQMDCVDESTNTDTLLSYLEARGLLVHHKVRSRVSRGMLFDGRYPHWTAVLRDASGKDWAVDSWYEAAGGPPDIMPLSDWRTRGIWGER